MHVRSFRCNPFGTPYFNGMMMRLEQTYKASFYGYCNGDLLFHSSLLGVLRMVRDKIRANELRTHVGSSEIAHA